MTTIITLDESAYSIQRAGFWPRARLRSYQRRAGKATARWAAALKKKKSATAGPIGRSKSVRWAGTSVFVAVSKAR